MSHSGLVNKCLDACILITVSDSNKKQWDIKKRYLNSNPGLEIFTSDWKSLFSHIWHMYGVSVLAADLTLSWQVGPMNTVLGATGSLIVIYSWP